MDTSKPAASGSHKRKILIVTSEAHPLMKTGGLGDVCGSLPQALRAQGAEVRLLMPCYHDSRLKAGRLKNVAQITLPGLAVPVNLLEGLLPGTRIRTWLIDFAPAYDRAGNPYLDPQGQPWHDNAARFALLARVAVAIARDLAGLAWIPDVVHSHDWQAGLVPALLHGEKTRPATVFTIHNLAYQGLFSYQTFQSLHLPESLWSFQALEFHGQLSFIKGGIAFADRITTVSPTYANEIQTPAQGCGLDGLLRHRHSRLSGILNGIDTRVWDPARDPHLVSHYSRRHLKNKLNNKIALQKEFRLPVNAETALFGMVSRLVSQKGVDLLINALPALMTLPLQIVVLGDGEAQYLLALQDQAARYPDRLAVFAGYDESVAHRVQAGADFFLMPSRFEPCGLSQLYSMRYGTVPIVRRIGGLADTVVDVTDTSMATDTATGIVFDEASAAMLFAAIQRALLLYADRRSWKQLQLAGMRQDFSWNRSAADYLQLYETAIGDSSELRTAPRRPRQGAGSTGPA